ncbi:Hsp70 family protein [Streptomyces glaucus]
MARSVGIGLGTTDSVVPVPDGGEPTVVTGTEGGGTTPLVAAFARNGGGVGTGTAGDDSDSRAG